MAKSRKDPSPEVSPQRAPADSRWLTYRGPHPHIARMNRCFVRGQPRPVPPEVADVLLGTDDFDECAPPTTGPDGSPPHHATKEE